MIFYLIMLLIGLIIVGLSVVYGKTYSNQKISVVVYFLRFLGYIVFISGLILLLINLEGGL